MASVDRTFSDVLHDIVGHVQDIVRSEVRLAKIELRETLTRSRTAAALLFIGGLCGLFGALFLLLAVMFALSAWVPYWAAALIVAAGVCFGSVVALSAGLRTLKKVQVAPVTMASMKENVEWAKQQVR